MIKVLIPSLRISMLHFSPAFLPSPEWEIQSGMHLRTLGWCATWTCTDKTLLALSNFLNYGYVAWEETQVSAAFDSHLWWVKLIRLLCYENIQSCLTHKNARSFPWEWSGLKPLNSFSSWADMRLVPKIIAASTVRSTSGTLEVPV